jgi:hypothetical protein
VSKRQDLREEKCEHVVTGQYRFAAGLQDRKTGRTFVLCQPCLISFLQMQGLDPSQVVIGYNFYMSTDPDLPKKRWRKMNDELIPDTKYEIGPDKLEPGVTYYSYVTAVSVLGGESAPSKVMTMANPPAE